MKFSNLVVNPSRRSAETTRKCGSGCDFFCPKRNKKNFLIILDRYNEVLIFFQCTTTTASESHSKNGAHCNCCYCEVFGPGGQSVAPVSRNYPEMRERLRLLLSKKKRKNQQKPPPPPPKKHAEQQQQQQHQHQV